VKKIGTARQKKKKGVKSVLVFSELERNPSFAKVKTRPFFQVLIDGVRVES
jgi:hypothetical protein